MDLCEADPSKYQPGIHFIKRVSHERALKSSSSYLIYAIAIFHDYFDDSVTLYCTCAGSEKGRAADGHARASLPKEALSVFLGIRIKSYTKSNLCIKRPLGFRSLLFGRYDYV
jgi:hypothetical protein